LMARLDDGLTVSGLGWKPFVACGDFFDRYMVESAFAILRKCPLIK
jgi:hypothetical protein